ncbi:MAG: UDP-N-acetylmuramoyl-L-alanyl-D-glutamate--2,6-diaminopimelate ligase [Pseudomonadota bacterium]
MTSQTVDQRRTLGALIGGDGDVPEGARSLPIAQVALDSRKVAHGALFAALPGSTVDGARFVPQALAAGASAILCARDADVDDDLVPVVRCDDPRRTLALAASRFFARQPDVAVAVTGTSGKTSVAEFTRQMFAKAGHQAASVGTLGIVRPDESAYGGLTTPDPVTLHQTLAELAGEGVTHLAFEASSHGLDQRRLDGVHLQAAAFTNLGRDHLDYHADEADYFRAKLRLFDTLLPDGKPAVVFTDAGLHRDRNSPVRKVIDTVAKRGGQVVLAGASDGDIFVTDQRDADGQMVLGLSVYSAAFETAFPLIGDYQVANVLVALGLATAVGVDAATAVAALGTMKGVPGRLEPIGQVNGARVLVDYAHKPDALEAVLTTLKLSGAARVICVFGCGGDRDAGKRPMMGAIAERLADRTIVTDDNPRTEDPAAIRQAILAAAPSAREIGDRAEAIGAAISEARAGDMLVIAGKGHETGQIVGDQVLPFSDQDVARAAITAHGGSVV